MERNRPEQKKNKTIEINQGDFSTEPFAGKIKMEQTNRAKSELKFEIQTFSFRTAINLKV